MLWNSLAVEHARFFPNVKNLFSEEKIISEEEKSSKLINSCVGGVGSLQLYLSSEVWFRG